MKRQKNSQHHSPKPLSLTLFSTPQTSSQTLPFINTFLSIVAHLSLETINWDNIKTQDMSSDVFNFKGGHNISNDVKMLISKLDLNNDSEFNFNNIFTNNWLCQ